MTGGVTGPMNRPSDRIIVARVKENGTRVWAGRGRARGRGGERSVSLRNSGEKGESRGCARRGVGVLVNSYTLSVIESDRRRGKKGKCGLQ